MKKIMTAMLGLSLLTGAVAFAADKDTTKDSTKTTSKTQKVSKTHKGGKKSTEKKTT